MTRSGRKRRMPGLLRRVMLAVSLCALLGFGVSCAPADPAETAKTAEGTAIPEITAGSAPDGALQVTFFDVGKGDCILVSRNGSHIMIDTGFADTADRVIYRMRRAGVTRLDALILTHYDKDHIGGAKAVIGSFPVGQVYLPGYEGTGKQYNSLMYALRDASPARVTEDTAFTIAGMDFRICASTVAYIPAAGKDEGNDTDVSLVVDLRFGEDSYLFPGDIEKAGIRAYLSAGHGAYDVVKMPHHGKKEGNSDDFLDQAQPKITVITDAPDDPANEKLLNLLAKAGADVYTSSECGTIVITSVGSGTYSVVTETGAGH